MESTIGKPSNVGKHECIMPIKDFSGRTTALDMLDASVGAHIARLSFDSHVPTVWFDLVLCLCFVCRVMLTGCWSRAVSSPTATWPPGASCSRTSTTILRRCLRYVSAYVSAYTPVGFWFECKTEWVTRRSCCISPKRRLLQCNLGSNQQLCCLFSPAPL